ncbi:MAG: deoxyribose-phosphate aldolase [Bacteroidales bacterium]|jgi:deoxyribose-phosphate aldolase|nr:deoxyribose-phosphate aldolase [Bacteroidales bacterium]
MNYFLNSELINKTIKECELPHITGLSRTESLRLILSCLDLTSLEGSDHDEKIIDFCIKAKSFNNFNLPNVAAVCVYPVFARLVRKNLENSNIKTACVAGAFPAGQSPLNIRLDEVKFAVDEGAQEIDMVISRGRFLQGDYDYITKEIDLTKKACGNAHLKVILETGELGSNENIRKASNLAIEAGADFIKTSTGKIKPAATFEAVVVMLETIKEHYLKTGKMIGIKPAGGISEPDQAILYANLVERILGKSWLNNHYFRIGASRLTDNIVKEFQTNQ